MADDSFSLKTPASHGVLRLSRPPQPVSDAMLFSGRGSDRSGVYDCHALACELRAGLDAPHGCVRCSSMSSSPALSGTPFSCHSTNLWSTSYSPSRINWLLSLYMQSACQSDNHVPKPRMGLSKRRTLILQHQIERISHSQCQGRVGAGIER